MEPKKDEVGVRLDEGLQERVGAYAAREGLTARRGHLGAPLPGPRVRGAPADRAQGGHRGPAARAARPQADGRRPRARPRSGRSASSPTGPRRPAASACRRTSFWPRAAWSRTRSGRGSSPSAGSSRPGRSRGSWRGRWTASRCGASAPTTWPSAGSRSWRGAGSTRRARSCSSRSAPASSRCARTPLGSRHLFREDAFHAPNGHFLRMTLRVEPHALGEAGGPRAARRRATARGGDARPRSCARCRGRRASTWRASSPRPGTASSRSSTSS